MARAMSDLPIPDSPNNTVIRFTGRVNSRTSTSTLSWAAIRMSKLSVFTGPSQVVSLHQTVRDLIDAQESKHDKKGDADSLKMLEQERRPLQRIEENRANCKYILLAVELCKQAPQRNGEIAQTDIRGEPHGHYEINTALEKNGDSKYGYHLPEEMGTAVFPDDLPVDYASLPDAAAEHGRIKVKGLIIVYPVSHQVGNFQEHEERDRACDPYQLCEPALDKFALDEQREEYIAAEYPDDLRD